MNIHADATKQRLLGEFDAVVDQAEQGFTAATERLATMRDRALGQANDAARSTDEYVQGKPWHAIGVAAAIAAGAGLVIGLLMSRR